MKVVNLSRRRFVNIRPVTRTTAVLWALGAALIATNLYLYLQYWIDSVEVRSQRQQTLDLIDQQRDAIRDLNRRFDRLDLPVQNSKVEFLNALIDARTFPWSQLFDDLEEVLIPDARVTSVQPAVEVRKKERAKRRLPVPTRSSRSRRARGEAAGSEEAAPPPEEPERREVRLSMRGYVKDDQALADLVDAFYADPSFKSPYLAGENADTSVGGLSFTLDVTYLLPIEPAPTIELPDESVAAGSPSAGSPSGTAPPPAVVAEAEGAAEPSSEAPVTAEDAVDLGSEEDVRASLRPEPGEAASPRVRPPAPGREPSRLAPTTRPRVVASPSAGLPSAGLPSAGTPSAGLPSAGTPSAGLPSAGSPVVGAPVGTPPSRVATPPLRPAGVPRPPASPAVRPVAPDSPRSPPPPPVRPKFVGPAATGTPRVTGGGGIPQ